MRFLQPNRDPADADRSPVKPSMDAEGQADDRSGKAAPDDESRAQPRPSEGVRILLEKLDSLTSRLSACEQTIELMSRQIAKLAERQASDIKDLEDRLRRQVERQVADLSVTMDRQQKEAAARQAKLLELLATEINKVRTIAEAPEAGGVVADSTRAISRSSQARRRAHGFAPVSGSAASDIGVGLADVLAQGPTPHQEDGPDGLDLEFWDWLETLPADATAPPVTDDIHIDLDIDDLGMEPGPPTEDRSR